MNTWDVVCKEDLKHFHSSLLGNEEDPKGLLNIKQEFLSHYLLHLISKISVTSRTLLRNIYGWQKAIKTKEMTENSLTSNDCRFTYMLDFILKPAGKLEYQDNASLFKFKGNVSIDTCRKSRWKFVCE